MAFITKKGCKFSIILLIVSIFTIAHKNAYAYTNDTITIPASNYEYIPDASYQEIEKRLQAIETTIPLNYNMRVKAFIDYFTVRNREHTKKILQKKALYFPLFEKYLAKYNLPDELKYLSIIESALEPKIKSHAGAVGLWQFMPSTGQLFKLGYGWYFDEKQDPEKATIAACKYLKMLYESFGDWELALASYNAGPGRVKRAFKKAPESKQQKGFWGIYNYLPRETRSYVPQFVAMIYTLNFAEEHNLFVDEIKHPMAYDTIKVNQFVNLRTLANEMNVCMDEIEALNPELKVPVIPAGVKNYELKIPADKKMFFLENREKILTAVSIKDKETEKILAVGKASAKEKTYYRVRKGDVLGKIAHRFHVRVSDLKRWNRIRGNLIRPGQKLVVWTKPKHTTQPNSKTYVAQNKTAPPKVYMVQPGDSLWSISQKYNGVTISQIMKLNKLKNNKIKPGQKLIIS